MTTYGMGFLGGSAFPADDECNAMAEGIGDHT